MDKKNAKKNVQTDKVIYSKIKKERGDDIKKQPEESRGKTGQIDMTTKKIDLAMGDSKRKLPEPKEMQKKKKKNDATRNAGKHNSNATETKKLTEKSVEETRSKLLDVIERKKLRDKYTFRFSNPGGDLDIVQSFVTTEVNSAVGEEKPDVSKICRRHKRHSNEFGNQQNNKPDASFDSGISDTMKADKKDADAYRKPIIRTVTSRNDATKIYKAVTFVDQQKKHTSLEVKIPRDAVKKSNTAPKLVASNISKIKMKPINSKLSIKDRYTDSSNRSKSTISKTSDKEKPVKTRKKGRKSMAVSSPELSLAESPPVTEVAKWAPTCINQHTKPYYEAWVNTTLAAISRDNNPDGENQKFLKSFRNSLLERKDSPVLTYANMSDEKYTGRIKISHR